MPDLIQKKPDGTMVQQWQLGEKALVAGRGNLDHNVALYFMRCNSCRIHQCLRTMPAMEAGAADHVWNLEDMVG